MKRQIILFSVLILAVSATVAFAQQAFNIGDHVLVGSTNTQGTIIEVGAQMLNGGVLIKVHSDSLGAQFPNIGVWYDTVANRVSKQGGSQINPTPTQQGFGFQPGKAQQPPATAYQAPAPAYQPQSLAPQQQTYAAPADQGPPGLGPPPAMDAPARPGYGPAQ